MLALEPQLLPLGVTLTLAIGLAEVLGSLHSRLRALLTATELALANWPLEAWLETLTIDSISKSDVTSHKIEIELLKK